MITSQTSQTFISVTRTVLSGIVLLFAFHLQAQTQETDLQPLPVSLNTQQNTLDDLATLDTKLAAYNTGLRTLENTSAPSLKVASDTKAEILAKEKANTQYLLYYPNKGQLVDTDGKLIPQVEYVVNQPGMKVYIRKTGLSYVFEKTEAITDKRSPLKDDRANPAIMDEPKDVTVSMHRVDINFGGATAATRIVETGKNKAEEHYYLAHCPDGVTVNGFEKVVMEGIYPDIDLILYTKDGHLKYDWLVKAGADPALIQMEIKGTNHYKIDSKGSLILETPLGTITETAPEIFQGTRQIVGSYKLANGKIAFDIDEYNRSEDLLVDPLREWATLYGGSGNDFGHGGCATDNSGNVFVHGSTRSTGFPVSSGAFQSNYGGGLSDSYIVKFNASGNREWATYYGGSNDEFGLGGCATDGSGNVFVHGKTNSTNFPVSSGAFQTSNGGLNDAYIIKLNASGNRQWATYYGGNNVEDGRGGCATDDLGNVFVHGNTWSLNFPVSSGAFQSSHGGGTVDAYIVKLNASGGMEWATYYGGSNNEEGRGGCATDNSGNVFVHGHTSSTDFPVSVGAFQTSHGGGLWDAYIVKLNPSGNRQWATYFGGSDNDLGQKGCATDASGNVFVQGYTSSTNFPVSPGAFQTAYGGGINDAYIVKLSASGSREWATYYGGSGTDVGFGGCATDNSGNVFIHGWTNSTDFPVSPGAFQTSNGGDYDDYIVKLSPSGQRLGATYYGGIFSDSGHGGCATDNSGNVFVQGNTFSTNFPISTGAYQTSLSGGFDAYIVKFNSLSASTSSCEITANCQPFVLALYATGNATLQPSDINNGSTVTCGTPTLTVSKAVFTCADLGVNSVTLYVTDDNNNIDSCTTTVTVVDNITPILTCVASGERFVNTATGYVVAGTEFDPPSVSDNCSGNLEVIHNAESLFGDQSLSSTTLAGWNIPIGVHTLTYTASNGINVGSCQVTIEVKPLSLSGIVDIGDNCNPVPIRIELYEAGTPNANPILVQFYIAQMNSDGSYMVILSNLEPGTYGLYLKPETYLKVFIGDIVVDGAVTAINLANIIPGDIDGSSDGDNVVNSNDLSILLQAFNAQLGSPGYNSIADIVCNSQINILDLSLFMTYYQQVGANPQD